MDKDLAEMQANPREPRSSEAVERDRADRLEHELGMARQKVADQEQQVDSLKRELESQACTISEAENSLADLRSRLAQTESALVQRRHEAEQTGIELAGAREELRQLDAVRQQNEKVLAGYKEHIEQLDEDVHGRHSAFAALELAHAAKMKELYEEFSATARQVKRVMAELDTARQDLVTKLRDSQQHQSRLKDEVVLLAQLVDQKEDQARQHERQTLNTRQLAARELGRIVNAFMGRSSRAYIFGRLQQRRQLGLLGKTGLVDPEWYLRRYPDVADAGLDPVRHYAEFGAREGREPNGLLAGTNGTGEPNPREANGAKGPVAPDHDERERPGQHTESAPAKSGDRRLQPNQAG